MDMLFNAINLSISLFIAIEFFVGWLLTLILFIIIKSFNELLEKITNIDLDFIQTLLIFMTILYIFGYINILFIHNSIFSTIFIISFCVLLLLRYVSDKILIRHQADFKEFLNISIISFLINFVYHAMSNNNYILLHQSAVQHILRASDLFFGDPMSFTPSYSYYPFVIISIFYPWIYYTVYLFTHNFFYAIGVAGLFSIAASSIFLTTLNIKLAKDILDIFVKNKTIKIVLSSLMPLFTLSYGGMNESMVFTPRGFLYVIFLAVFFEFLKNEDKIKGEINLFLLFLLVILSYACSLFCIKYYSKNLIWFFISLIFIFISFFSLFKLKNKLYFILILLPLIHTFETPLYLLLLFFFILFEITLRKKFFIFSFLCFSQIVMFLYIFKLTFLSLVINKIYSLMSAYVIFDVGNAVFDISAPFYGMSFFALVYYFPVIYILINGENILGRYFRTVTYMIISALFLNFVFLGSSLFWFRFLGPLSIVIFFASALTIIRSNRSRLIFIFLLILSINLFYNNLDLSFLFPLLHFRHPVGIEANVFFSFLNFSSKLPVTREITVISSDIYGATQLKGLFRIKTLTVSTVMSSIVYDITETRFLNETIYIYQCFSYFSIICDLNHYNRSVVLFLTSRGITALPLPNVKIGYIGSYKLSEPCLDYWYYRGIALNVTKFIKSVGLIIYLENINPHNVLINYTVFNNVTKMSLINGSTIVPANFKGIFVIVFHQPLMLSPGSYIVAFTLPKGVKTAWSTDTPYNYLEFINGSWHASPRKFFASLCTSVDQCLYFNDHSDIKPREYFKTIIDYYLENSDYYISQDNNIIIAYYKNKKK